jgi:hypothetical protein
MPLPRFYTGTHREYWLWNGTAGFPLCVSHRGLRDYGRLHPATAPEWMLDSGGFTELQLNGAWTISPREYCEAVARYDREIGRLAWAAPQDWMCEPAVIAGGAVGRLKFAGTHLSVAEHQRRTVANFTELEALWPQYSDHQQSPFMPVLQGWEPADYLRCAAMYGEAGVDLAAYPVVGVGSVCRRSGTAEISAVADAIAPLELEHHWFGVKLDGIRRAGLRLRDAFLGGELVNAGAVSLDSASWSFDARFTDRMEGCTHANKAGRPSQCNNCPRYAAAWREKVLARLEEAQYGPAQEAARAA